MTGTGLLSAGSRVPRWYVKEKKVTRAHSSSWGAPYSSGLPGTAHLVGIGGCGMAGLARLLVQLGVRVSGSDRTLGRRVESLRRQGVRISRSQDASLVGEAELVVRSAAVPDTVPDVRAALDAGTEVVSYAEMLGRLLRTRDAAVICGTHGKTTTTAMVASCLVRAGFAPGYLVGGSVPELGHPADVGRSPLFVAEGCEYGRSFLHLLPRAAVVTNVEAEHLDTYPGGLPEIQDAFRAFIGNVRREGLVVLPERLRGVLLPSWLQTKVRTFGDSPGADWRAEELFQIRGCFRFVARAPAFSASIPIGLSVPGMHNVSNALAAVALLHELGVGPADIGRGLSDFRGVERRLQTVPCSGAVTLLDDYAHHPTEVRAVLAATRGCHPTATIWTVFQPHLLSRLRAFLDDFALALLLADQVLVAPVYGAREASAPGELVSESVRLTRAVLDRGGEAIFLPDHSSIVEHLARRIQPGDVVLTLGAGDVTDVCRVLAGQLA